MKQTPLLTLSLTALLGAAFLGLHHSAGRAETPAAPLFGADDPHIQYTGRVDFTDPKKPKFWAPGVYVRARFQGQDCAVVINDEVLYGKSHNYVEIAVDDRPPFRVQTKAAVNTIPVAQGLSPGPHTVTVCKDTESGIGYLELVGFKCRKLLAPPAPPKRRLEFIGDSITCGTGSDQSEKPCGQGEWYDQHNAYGSYGPATARALGAQWQLTSKSGIGLMHSCCDMKIVMPQVFDKVNLEANGGTWDFKRYQPDAVTVCLGQNDGQQDPKAFADAYVAFLKQIRAAYPKAQIVCLTSPMADATLTAYQKTNLAHVADIMHAGGDPNVHTFFFSRSYNGGCGGHPDLAQHGLIAAELSGYLKSTLGW